MIAAVVVQEAPILVRRGDSKELRKGSSENSQGLPSIDEWKFQLSSWAKLRLRSESGLGVVARVAGTYHRRTKRINSTFILTSIRSQRQTLRILCMAH